MLKYHVVNQDRSENILWITGGGVSKWMYENQMEMPYRHIIFDLPGHGDNSNYVFSSIEETVDLIKEVLEVENLETISIVGHSIGAQILMYMLEHCPERVDKAFVISGLNKPMKWALSMLSPMVSMSMPLLKMKWFSKLQSKEIALPDDMFDRYYDDSLLMTKETLLNVIKANMSFRMTESKVDGGRVTFIVGNKEKGMMIKSAEANHELVAGSRLIRMEAAHGIPYELPRELNSIIVEKMKE